MIEAIAIMIGTTARNDAKTKASTISAPNPPSSGLEQDARPVAATRRLLERVEPGHVDRGAAHRRARDALPCTSFAACGLSPKLESGSGFG